jgi:hypothetical protein
MNEQKINKLFRTRKELETTGEINIPPYSIITEAYKLLHEGKETKIHIPHSDVYFVRIALEKHSGFFFPLNVVEEAMRLEGWKEQRHVYLGKSL